MYKHTVVPHDDKACPICRHTGEIPSEEALNHIMGNMVALGLAKPTVKEDGTPAWSLTAKGIVRAEKLILTLANREKDTE